MHEVAITASLIETIIFSVFLFWLWRFSVNMRKEYHKQTRAKVDRFWAEVERDYPGTLARLDKMNEDKNNA